MLRSEMKVRRYLHADDIRAAGGLIDGTVAYCIKELMPGDEGTKKHVLYFSAMKGAQGQPIEAKPMILNATNIDYLFDNLKCDDTEAWTAARVRIKVEKVRFRKDIVDGLRFVAVRGAGLQSAPQPAAPPPDEDKFGLVPKGTTTLTDEIDEKFRFDWWGLRWGSPISASCWHAAVSRRYPASGSCRRASNGRRSTMSSLRRSSPGGGYSQQRRTLASLPDGSLSSTST
jgi:hypothetical protein